MAGRKPVKEKVVPLTIYLLPSRIEQLGGRDTVREMTTEYLLSKEVEK